MLLGEPPALGSRQGDLDAVAGLLERMPQLLGIGLARHDEEDAHRRAGRPAVQDGAHVFLQNGGGKRAGEEAVGSHVDRHLLRIAAGEGGRDDQDRNLVEGRELGGAQKLAEAPPVDARHVQVGDDDVDPLGPVHHLQRLLGPEAAVRVDSGVSEDRGDQSELGWVVVDDDGSVLRRVH